jgi:hypothetical protein
MSGEEAPLVLETPGGLCVSYRGRLLYSGRDPAGLPRRIAAACDRGPARLHLVPSPLLWHGVKELLASMGGGSAVLCVETDPALAALARGAMPAELASDPRLAFIEPRSRAEAVEKALGMGSFRSCSLVALSGGMALDEARYRAMAAAIGSEFESFWRNRAALMILGPRWAMNIFDNLAALPRLGASPLPRFAGPAFVCGAGPSLEGALGLIARLRSGSGPRPAVIACDTALGSLLAAGIEPDLVVCLEGQAHNLADFTCLGSKPAALAADLSSHPAGLRAVAGPKHLTLVRITRSPFLGRVEAALSASGVPFATMPPLGSVGVHAFHLAGQLCSGPLFAAGLDFSFQAGKTHARGCPSLLTEERRLARLTRWPGQYEASFRDRTIRLGQGEGGREGPLSDPILLSYASLLADLAASGGAKAGASEPPAMYDIRGGGPPIGCRRLTLAEAEAMIEGLGAAPIGPGAGAGGAEPGASVAACGAAIAALLAAELARLEELRAALREGQAVSREELTRLIEEADYLWWDFPDRPQPGLLAQDFLNRLVPRIEFWAARIASLGD